MADRYQEELWPGSLRRLHADIPDRRPWLDAPDQTMPLEIGGVGQVGITGAAAAIANAVFHATGRRVPLPINSGNAR